MKIWGSELTVETCIAIHVPADLRGAAMPPSAERLWLLFFLYRPDHCQRVTFSLRRLASSLRLCIHQPAVLVLVQVVWWLEYGMTPNFQVAAQISPWAICKASNSEQVATLQSAQVNPAPTLSGTENE